MPAVTRSLKRRSVKAILSTTPALPGYLLAAALFLIPLLVLPEPVQAAADLGLSPQSAPVGATVVISGEGFSGSLATITWDDVLIAEEVPVSSGGSISYELEVPHAIKGEHTIFVSDDSNWSESTASAIFNVLPSIRVFPPQSAPQTQLTITGHGFGKHETGISLILDGTVVSTTLTSADAVGTWNIVYNLPNISRGEHMIGAQGSTTYAGEVDEVVFLVTPWSRVTPASGAVGSTAMVEGYGFKTSEVGISISWDDEVIVSGLDADTEGIVRTEIEVPPSSYGKHAIGTYGKLYTLKGKVPKSYFEVLPSLTLDPDTAGTGERVTLRGTGLAADDKVVLTFDGDEVEPSLRSNESGTVRTFLIVPETQGGSHTVALADSKGNSAEADLHTLKFTAAAAPQPLFPTQDERFAVFDSIGSVYVGGVKYLFGTRPLGLTDTELDWTLQNETGDERYVLQIARSTSFDLPLLDTEVTGSSSYTLPQSDALPPGNYFWRVKVIDDLGRESPWSDAGPFRVILIPLYVAVLSGLLLLLFIAAVVLGIRVAWMSSYYR